MNKSEPSLNSPLIDKLVKDVAAIDTSRDMRSEPNTELEELLRQEIDRIFLEEYNALHDNFFHSEFEASRSASLKVLSLIAQKVAEAVETELSYFADGALDMIPRSAVKDRLKQIRSK